MNQPNKKDALGKGIRSLLQNIDSDLKTTAGTLKSPVAETVMGTHRLTLDKISINPKQPRRDFDEQSLNELADSIKLHDIIQPITVTQLADGKFQLISGERRYRAAKLAGLKDIPSYVRQANDQQLLELALLENLQREDLNAIEIALSYKRMMEELEFTQEQVAERMGKERSTVTNYIRLLKLAARYSTVCTQWQFKHGPCPRIVNVDSIDKQLFIFKEIREKGLSVRQTEELVRQLYKGEEKQQATKPTLPPAYKRIEDSLASFYGTKVKLAHSKKGTGSINIEYYSLQELNKILEQMNVPTS